MTDYKQLCAELLDELKNAIRVIHREDGTRHIRSADPVITKADIALAQPAQPEEGMLTDEELWKIWDENDGPIPTILRLAIAAARARRTASEPPADGEVGELVKELRRICFDVAPCDDDIITRAADLLAQRHPEPVPVSERLPGPGDCDAEGRCWWGEPQIGDSHDATWNLCTQDEAEEYCTWGTKYGWLPAHALPLPTAND